MKHYKRESDFQADLIKTLENRFPGCIVLKNDANYKQGIPDLSVFYGNHWAALENKLEEDSNHQGNQDWYVNKMNDMSFARIVYPGNVEEVLNEMERSFQVTE